MVAPIFVALDGSPAAEVALPWAIALAEKSQAPLRMLGVHAPASAIFDSDIPVVSYIPDDVVRKQEWNYFNDLMQRVQRISKIEVGAEVLDGSVVDTLCKHIETHKPSFVVMGTHGRGALARFFLGSTSTLLSRNSSTPLLLIREKPGIVDLQNLPDIHHVLVPVDGSPLSEEAIEPAIRFGKLWYADYSLLMSLDGVPDIAAFANRHEEGLPGAWDEKAVPKKAAAYLRHLQDRFASASLKATASLVEHESACKAIVAAAKARSGTAIAMTTHGRGGLTRAIRGSVAEKVVHEYDGPILLYRPSTSTM
jgi:nucleotide-binding universal stress UspA family protein